VCFLCFFVFFLCFFCVFCVFLCFFISFFYCFCLFVYLIERIDEVHCLSDVISLLCGEFRKAETTTSLVGAGRTDVLVIVKCGTGSLVVTLARAERACGIALIHVLGRLHFHNLLGCVETLGFLPDILATGEVLKRLHNLLGCVETLGFLPDILATGEVLKRLHKLLGCVETLGFLPDVLATGKTLKRLGGLDLLHLLGRRRVWNIDDLFLHRASARIVIGRESTSAMRADHTYQESWFVRFQEFVKIKSCFFNDHYLCH
jgi:hypothetical protein